MHSNTFKEQETVWKPKNNLLDFTHTEISLWRGRQRSQQYLSPKHYRIAPPGPQKYIEAWRVQVQSNNRLTLIASDPRISAALFILSISKMILIYLNYKLWLVQWKIILTKILDTVVLDRKELDGFYYNHSQ